jgi:hypothetical protein
MSQPRFRLRLWQAGLLIVLCAVAFALFRTPGGIVLLIMVGPVLPGFIIDLVKGGSGIRGGMLSAGLTSGGFWLGCYVFNLPASPEASLPLLVFLLLMGSIWGTFVSILLYLIVKYANPIWQKCLTEDGCGPIVWRASNGDQKPPSAASHGSWMRGNHA